MLHGSEMWKVKKENKLTLQQAEMKQLGECDIKITDRFSISELTERLGIDYTRMWTDDQRDGCPAQYRWHPLRKFCNYIPGADAHCWSGVQ